MFETPSKDARKGKNLRFLPAPRPLLYTIACQVEEPTLIVPNSMVFASFWQIPALADLPPIIVGFSFDCYVLWKLRLIPSFSILILIGHRFAACGKVFCDGSSWHPIPSTINSSNLFNFGISTVTLQIIKGVPSHASSTYYV